MIVSAEVCGRQLDRDWVQAGLNGQNNWSTACHVAPANLSPHLLPLWLQPNYLSDQWCAAYFEQVSVSVIHAAMQQ